MELIRDRYIDIYILKLMPKKKISKIVKLVKKKKRINVSRCDRWSIFDAILGCPVKHDALTLDRASLYFKVSHLHSDTLG